MKYLIMILMLISFNLQSGEIKIIQYKYKIGISDNRYSHKVFAESICNALNQKEENSCILVNTESSKNLMNMLDKDAINLAFSQEDVAFNSSNKSHLKKIIVKCKKEY
jgi:TRAP-type uncharacterized transport system substrate-binding protein